MSTSKSHKKTSVILSLAAYIVVATACAPQPDAVKNNVRVVVSFDVPKSMVSDSNLEVRKQFHEAFEAVHINPDISNIEMSVGDMDISEAP